MQTDITLYHVRPGDQGFSSTVAGQFAIRGIEAGQTFESQKCLSIAFESRPSTQALTTEVANGGRVVALSWLQLDVSLWTRSTPRHRVGQVHIEPKGMLPLGGRSQGQSTWLWEINPEDVEVVEQSNQPNVPIYLNVEINGIAKVIDAENSQFLGDIVVLQGSNPQLSIEASHWERLIQQLGYKTPPSQATLVGRASLEHPSWTEATKRLEKARSHHRSGEDYEALRVCLSTLESLVSPPYSMEQWKQRLAALPEQKAVGLAELFSGFATYCNKVGHHRSRTDRAADGHLPPMPLDHWEADLATAMAQYVTAYALRLRTAEMLADAPAAPAAPPSD